MNCFKKSRTKETPNPENKTLRHDVLLGIRGCRVHLMDGGEAVELAAGEFELQRITDGGVSLATAVKVGDELQWPLTRDEPVVKLDALHYLFSLPMKDGQQPLSYGVAFPEKSGGELGKLDSLLKENCLFTAPSSSSGKRKEGIEWKEFAPAVESYNSFLAKAIAGGTGHIVKGIFKCSNAYTNKVQKGGETILVRAAEDKSIVATADEKATKKTTTDNQIRKSESNGSSKNKASSLNKSLKRVRKLSRMTEKLSKRMLNVVEGASGSVMAPVVQSRAGKAFLSMAPGEVILASFDALDKIIDAAEAAEKQTMRATSGALKHAVTNRYGESAGETTEHALATAGHCACAAWNIFKIRKAITPASATATGVLKSIPK